MDDSRKVLYTPKEAGLLMGVSDHFLKAGARSGEFPHRRLGKRGLILFSREDLEQIKDASAVPAQAQDAA